MPAVLLPLIQLSEDDLPTKHHEKPDLNRFSSEL